MHRSFEEDLQRLSDRLLEMGNQVEKAIHLSVEALMNRHEPTALQVIKDMEPLINAAQLEVDEQSLRLLALQQPIASDLRRVTAVMKISGNLERMGDKAANIARRALSLLGQPELQPLVDIPKMARFAEEMVKQALDSFARKDVELAQQILLQDDELDRFRDQAFGELVSFMIKEPRGVQQALDLIIVARNLERIGDLATNIAEDVIYMVLGRDVRHHAYDKMESHEKADTGD